MPPIYQDFSLIVEGVPGAYTVEAEAPNAVRVPPQPFVYAATPEIAAELELIRKGRAPSKEQMAAIGGLLFGALFPLAIYGAFGRALGGAGSHSALRIKLLIRPPELNDLPWELLYNPHDGIFLAARLLSPIVRVVESANPLGLIAGPRPLRLLYVQANPPSTGVLDTAASEAALRKGLGDAAIVTPSYRTTPADLRRLLQTQPGFDVLHFDGHGTFGASDAAAGTTVPVAGRRELGAVPEAERTASASGAVILDGPNGTPYRLGSDQLAADLDGSGIRLVVFAACETGADGTTERFAGVAQHLMRTTAIPAIVAMQYAVADDAAIAFCAGFYGAIAAGYPVDAATVEGRKAILDLRGAVAGAAFAAPDWATPVLFMRANDGALFEPILTEEPRTMPDGQQSSDGTTINGSVNTGGGDFVGRDKIIHGDEVKGTKDARQGVFMSGGTVYGPVVGSNSGTITTSYGGPPQRSAELPPLEQALAKVQQTISDVRARGDDDQADDLKVVADALDAAIRADQPGKAARRAAKLQDAKDALNKLADQYPEAAALRVSLATLW